MKKIRNNHYSGNKTAILDGTRDYTAGGGPVSGPALAGNRAIFAAAGHA
ncbi:hypothetical protein [Herminiimonas sp. CN]|nr:hypothetical protein [Herminiimonas sp. CN]